MPGLVESQLDEEPVTQASDLSKGAGYKASQVDLDPNTDTVEGRLQGIIAKNSNTMKSAATRGLAKAQSRGLVNSSIAIGESERAVYDAATPIANADATNSLAVKTGNVNAQNAAKNLGATGTQALQQGTQRGLIESQQIAQQGSISSRLQAEKADIDMRLQSASASDAIELQRRRGEIDKELQAAGGDIQKQLMDQKAAIDLQLQSASAQDAIELQRQRGEIDKQIQAEQIRASAAEIDQRSRYDQQLQAQKGEIDKQLQSADAATRERLLAQQGQLDREMAILKGDQTIALTRQQGEIDRQLQELRGDQAIELTGAQAEQEKQLIAARSAADAQLETLRANLQTELTKLQGTQAENLARIDGEYKKVLQGSQSASVFYSQISASIGDILSNGDIKIDQKQALVNKQLELLENGLTVIGEAAGMDFAGLIDTTGTPLPTYAPGKNQRLPSLGGIRV